MPISEIAMRSGVLVRHGSIFLCVCFLCACSGENSSGETTSPGQTTHDTALKAGADTDVAYYGLSRDLKRNSDLNQINTETVKRLAPLWTLSLGENHGLQTQPLVIDGVMYVTTHDSTHAIDARTGRQIWKTLTEYSQETVNCCGFANRGLAFHDGKLYRTNVDNRILAIDPANGAILWEKDVIDPSIGYSMTSAPLIANNVLITGIGGAEFGAPGFLDGWDPETGEHLWRFNTIPEPGEPGSETWPGETWRQGGGGTWLIGSYDAELDLVYWGVGNPAPWSAQNRRGDNLYTSSMLAIRPKTGELVWYFQFTPNDTVDYDGNNEPILTELQVDGELRKVLIQANRNGFFYVLDRTNGEFIGANPFVEKVTWTDGLDGETGRPSRSNSIEHMLETGEPTEIWPTAMGAKNLAPMSYSPDTGLAYINAINMGWIYTPVQQEFKLGAPYYSIEFEWIDTDGAKGELKAIEPLSGKTAWSFPTQVPMNGGTLVTSGNLVFSGAQTGELYAYHAETGEKLWEYRTGSGIIAPPVTYRLDGKQYVAIASGLGGVYAAVSGDPYLKNINPGGAIWVFALSESLAARTPEATSLLPPPVNNVTNQTASAQVSEGRVLYNRNCAHCHGVDMVTAGNNYDLTQFPKNSEQRFISAIVNGKGNMPAWGDTLNNTELKTIYAYVNAICCGG